LPSFAVDTPPPRPPRGPGRKPHAARRRACAFAIVAGLGTVALAASGVGSVALHPALMAVPIVIALAQLCTGWRPALLLLGSLLGGLWMYGVGTAVSIGIAGAAGALVMLALEWRTREAVLGLVVTIAERNGDRDAVWVVDRRGRVVAANDRACMLADGASPVAADGRCAPALHYVDREGEPLALSPRTDCSARSIRVAGQDKLGPFDLEAWTLAAFDLAGVVRLDDRADFERLRLDGDEAAALLEQERAQSRARTREVEAMREAAESAGRAVRNREELLSLVSHDLRSALNAMVGWLYLARSPAAEAGSRLRALDGIASAVDTQRRLVDQLLDATRLLGGRKPAEAVQVETGALFQRVSSRVGPAAARRSITVRVTPSQAGLAFLADPSRAEESLYALVEHAIAITPGQAMVRLHAALVETEHGRTVRLAVESEGTGRAQGGSREAAAVRDDGHAPAPGRPASPTLSIAIARAVTELQGGSLDLGSSASGDGARFSLCFPSVSATTEDDASEAVAVAPSTVPDEAPANGAQTTTDVLIGCYILLVDDRDDMLDVTATTLRGHGAHVTTARSGAEAIERYPAWARGGGERLLISDLSMPEIDGLALLVRLRRLEAQAALPRVPAVAFSAQADQYARRTVIEAGFDLFLAKPLSPAQLIGAISPLIGR